MYPDLFSADLFEYQNIFESEIATSIFIYATAAILLVNVGLALLSSRFGSPLHSTQTHNRREGPGWAMPH
jgi:hypothetical protein